MAIVPTSEELTTLFEKDLLAGEMACRFMLRDPAEIQVVEARCAALHNEGTLDLFRLVENESMQRLNGTSFFIASHVFCRILPELETTPAQMMACVEALVTRGGEDGDANRPNAAFRDWCAKNPRRADDVIAAAISGDDLACRHLTFALESKNDISGARHIALEYEDARRLSAITALSRIEDNDSASQTETLDMFSVLRDRSSDDNLCANLLHATAAILERSRNAPSPETVALVRHLVKDAGKITMYQSARVLLANRKALQPDIVDSLLGALKSVDPANKGTLKELDLGLQTLLENGHDEAAIAYVTQLLSSSDGSIDLEEFEGFTKTLLSGPQERLSRVVVQWLLLGSPRLCHGLANALRGHDMEGPQLNLRGEDLAIHPAAQLFLCRKAIGWFFMKPTTATSVLVSVLRACDAETSLEVQKLLVEPMLLNYGCVREYLKGLASDDVAKDPVEHALAQNETYLEAIRAIPNIKELQPSESHRRIQSLRELDQMHSIRKQAQEQSLLFRLAKPSFLLYGRRSLSFVREGKGTLRPVEMDLKPYGVSFEIPRMEIVDPVDLDHCLRVFRAERMVP